MDKKTYKVHVPFIEKDFVVLDRSEDLAVSRVLDKELSKEDREILSKHSLVMCECTEVEPEELN